MSSTFSSEVADAAKIWNNYTISWAQLRDAGNNKMDVRMQSPAIMYEFVGSVEFGKDPVGMLWYHERSDFGLEDAEFKPRYVRASSQFTVVIIDFFVPGETNKAFARWIANVDTSLNQLPNAPRGFETGSGVWKTFSALTSEARIHKVTNSNRVRVRNAPILKQVFFNVANSPAAIDAHGILIARDLSQFQGETVADYAPTRIVFYRKAKPPTQVIALFLPDAPLKISSSPSGQPADAQWQDFKPESFGRAAPFRAAAGDNETTEALPEAPEYPADLHELAPDFQIQGLASAA